jgi:hypothetical protein
MNKPGVQGQRYPAVMHYPSQLGPAAICKMGEGKGQEKVKAFRMKYYSNGYHDR